MRVREKARTIVAQVKEGRSELTRGNTQAGVQANTTPHSDMRSEDAMRKSNSAPKPDADVQQKGAIGRPVVTSTLSNTGPPVPPHTSSPFSAARAPGNDHVARTQPPITRKPTQTEDSVVNGHAKVQEKPLPPLTPTTGSGPSLSQEIFMSNNINREPQSQALEAIEQCGPTLGQAVEEQTMKIQEQARGIKALQDMNLQHVIQIDKLKDELQKEKDRHAQTTQAWRKATASLSANRQEANYKVDDDSLRSHYENIIYDVAGWVSTHCLMKFEHLPESNLRIFSTLTPKPSKYYHVKRTRELLLQSLVMNDLAHLVLNRLWWAGKLSDNICTVQYAVEPGMYDRPYCNLRVGRQANLLLSRFPLQ
jgi:hypothetical protein